MKHSLLLRAHVSALFMCLITSSGQISNLAIFYWLYRWIGLISTQIAAKKEVKNKNK